jgi:hypothetical protein
LYPHFGGAQEPIQVEEKLLTAGHCALVLDNVTESIAITAGTKAKKASIVANRDSCGVMGSKRRPPKLSFSSLHTFVHSANKNVTASNSEYCRLSVEIRS